MIYFFCPAAAAVPRGNGTFERSHMGSELNLKNKIDYVTDIFTSIFLLIKGYIMDLKKGGQCNTGKQHPVSMKQNLIASGSLVHF